MKYKIYPIYLGGKDVDSSVILYRNPVGVRNIRMVIGAFILKGEDGEVILVDTGAPSANEIREKGYGLREMADSVEYIDALKEAGVDPEAVKLIIFTHLHWDHAWNLQYFPNAEFIVQKKEMASAICPTPNARRSYALFPEIGGPQWLKYILQFKAVNGDKQIRDGIKVITTPGHTPGSQSVIVDTEEGPYVLVSDLCMNMENYTLPKPTGSVNNVDEWYESWEKVKELGYEIIPTHDPDVYKRKVYG